MQGKESSPDPTHPPDASLSFSGRFVDRGEEFVYVVVAGLLLITATVTCGYAALIAVGCLQRGDPLQGIFFLVIGGISAARRILAIGANLSLSEAQHVEHASGKIGASVDWDRFNQAMIELGIDAGLIIVITLALLIIHRYTLRREAS
jgi:hypothetical protein